MIAALIIAGIEPVRVHPHFDVDLHLAHPPEPEDVQAAMRAHPDAKGMLLISPTDWGSCADIAGVAEVCREHGVPLIVDEAWGAHFPCHPGLPQWGMNVGADLVVTSVHKMGGAIEQSSMFQLHGDLVDSSVLKAREDLLGTTSSSCLVYATLDGWRRQMVEHGERLLGESLQRADRIHQAVEAMPGLSPMGREVIKPHGAFDLGRLVLTIDVRPLGITGYQAADWLRAACQVDVGSADACWISAGITHDDDDDTEQRLIAALRRLADERESIEAPPRVDLPAPASLEVETAMLPRDAFFGGVEQVPLDQALRAHRGRDGQILPTRGPGPHPGSAGQPGGPRPPRHRSRRRHAHPGRSRSSHEDLAGRRLRLSW